MRVAAAGFGNSGRLLVWTSGLGLTLLGWSLTTDFHRRELVPLVAVMAVSPIVYRVLRRWDLLLAALVLVILFIPIKRYKLPVTLPFDVEPYRLAAALLILGWIGALLIDSRVRLRRSILDRQIVLALVAVAGSIVANPARVGELSMHVLKAVTFFGSFVLVFYVIMTVVRREETVDLLVKTLVAGGAVVAVLSVVERRTHYNAFDHLSQFVPVLRFQGDAALLRGGSFRALASAQHPIALSALMVLLLPLAYFLCRSGASRIWWIAGVLLVMGDLSTASRTGIVMLLVLGIAFAWLRGADAKRMWPAVVPLLIVIHLVLPGALGTVRGSFLPKSGLIAEQRGTIDQSRAQNTRLSRISPALDQFQQHPFFGLGYGTRLTGAGEKVTNAVTLDDQWLGTLLETGLVGVLAWATLLRGAISRFARAARSDSSRRGDLLAALAMSTAAYAVGMFTYDAFAFIQVTFVLWILLALGCVTYGLPVGQRAAVPTPP